MRTSSGAPAFPIPSHVALLHYGESELRDAVLEFLRAGLDRKQIIIDPGLGFGKRKEQNAEILAQLDLLARLEMPTVLGGYNPTPRSPNDPILVRMTRTPCKPGLPSRDQHRAVEFRRAVAGRALVAAGHRHVPDRCRLRAP